MKEQKDWYIGTDYYVDYKEKRIQVQQLVVEEPVEQQLHEQAEMYYILEGELEGKENDQVVTLCAGDVMFTSFGDVHSVRNVTDKPAKMPLFLQAKFANVPLFLLYEKAKMPLFLRNPQQG